MGHARQIQTPATPSASALFPQPGHNHDACMSATLTHAKSAFEARGLKWTQLRETVLTEIASSHHAVGAYDIIANLAKRDVRLAPISVYRTIEILMTAGIVHRLESRNAYFVCRTPHASACENIVFACLECGTVAESAAPATFASLDTLAGRLGFAVSARLAEVTGRCAHCAKAQSPKAGQP